MACRSLTGCFAHIHGGRLAVSFLPTSNRKKPRILRFHYSTNPAKADSQFQEVRVKRATEDDEESTEEKSEKSLGFFPKKNQVLEFICESLAFKGRGVCKAVHSNFVLMCDNALPGERFIGRVTRPARKGKFAEVKKLQTITPHSNYVEAPCQYAEYCGGCRMQNLAYDAQVKAKEQQVSDLIIHVGKFPPKQHDSMDLIKPILPCDVQFNYRNKMEFSFGTKSWVPQNAAKSEGQDMRKSALGLHVPGFFDKIVAIKSCMLQHEVANKVLAIVQECWQASSELIAYDAHTHKGFLKHLVLRTGRYDSLCFCL
eukprot:TRINITY_DN20596_c0_g1_i2.p1 TRINITY_DN20596_c0_g1~~TRINITY_DN20596_c0_g1_i2.p1  ORF type:complete len:356 (+),score=43.46 TRINITY_DN20596_c0_g1_i2:130-1068(+)